MPNSSGAPKESDDWRETTLSHVRKLIEQADPEMVEERKWRKKATPEGVPVWSHNGMICTGETYKTHVKFTFARGASLKDPSSLLTPASKVIPVVRSTFMMARKSMTGRSRHSSKR